MNDKKFRLSSETVLQYQIIKNDTGLNENEVVDLLNLLSEENKVLKRRLEKINGGYGLQTRRNGLTANEWLIQSQEKELRKKDDKISEWIWQHSKDIVRIGEQNKIIKNLKEENEQLRTQLLICQQTKNDDGRFQVWEVPPIQKGMRITTFTTSDGDKDEI